MIHTSFWWQMEERYGSKKIQLITQFEDKGRKARQQETNLEYLIMYAK